jgi:YVTN family beta-propeller protein
VNSVLSYAGGPPFPERRVLTVIRLGSQPTAVAVNSVTNRVFVLGDIAGTLDFIDGTTNKLLQSIPMGQQPDAVAVNTQTNRVYASSFSGVLVADGQSGAVITTITIPNVLPGALAVDERTNTLYISEGTSKIYIVDGSTNKTQGSFGIGSGTAPTGIAVNPNSYLLYAALYATLQPQNVAVVDLNNPSTFSYVSTNIYSYAVAVNPATNTAYSTSTGITSIAYAIAAGASTGTPIAVGGYPNSVTVNPSINRIYVGNYWNNSVTVIDGASNQPTATVNVGSGPMGIAANASTNRIYTANLNDGTVSVLQDE